MPVDNGAGEQEVESGRGAAVVSSTWAVPMVRCNAMDETEGLLEVLVTRSDDFVAERGGSCPEPPSPRIRGCSGTGQGVSGQGRRLPVTQAGEGLARNRLARELGGAVGRVRESPGRVAACL